MIGPYAPPFSAEKRIQAWHRKVSQRLETIPGIGPITGASGQDAALTGRTLTYQSTLLRAFRDQKLAEAQIDTLRRLGMPQ